MKIKELRIKSADDLRREILDKKKELEKLRFDLAIKKIKNYNKIKETKKDIAKILTVMSEKKFLAESKENINEK